MSNCIRLGRHVVHRIDPSQVQPGDFLCTYEPLTTRSDLRAVYALLKLANFTRSPQFNHMFHAAVVVKKYPRRGYFLIANADGTTQKMSLQKDNLAGHQPGQAIFIFRPRDPIVQREVVSVAMRTAAPGNGLRCRVMHLNKWHDWMFYSFLMTRFECFLRRAPKSTVKRLAEMSIEYIDSGRFYSEGTESQEMSCLEYVANIVNVAMVRGLFPNAFEARSRVERTEAVFQALQHMNTSGESLLKFSHTGATPSGFVHAILENPRHFETVGYLGPYEENLGEPLLDIEGTRSPLSLERLKEVLKNSGFVGLKIEVYAIQVMAVLKMISSNGELLEKGVLDLAKIHTLFALLRKRVKGTELDEPINSSELQKFARRLSYLSGEAPFKEIRDSAPLTRPEIAKILALEKKCILRLPVERNIKTLKLSMNALEQERHAVAHLSSISNALSPYATWALKTVILFPIYLLLKISIFLLDRIARKRLTACERKRSKILSVYEKIRKNAEIVLTETPIPQGVRPWLSFQTEGDALPKVEPFVLDEKGWVCRFPYGKQKELHSRLFLGPEDLEDTNPVGNALAWESGVGSSVLEKLTIRPIGNGSLQLTLPEKKRIEWSLLEPSTPRAERVEQYFAQSHALAPTRQAPDSVVLYEQRYAELEKSMNPDTVYPAWNEEYMIKALQEFVRSQLGFQVDIDSVQAISNGLGQGLSGDRIYIISDARNGASFVIKTFMKPSGKFSREFFTMMNHERLQLQSLSIPKVRGIGKALFGNQHILFLAMDFVPGTSVYDLFGEYLACDEKKPEKRAIFQKLLHIYRKLGDGMVELHQAAQTEALPLHPAYQQLLELFCEKAVAAFRRLVPPEISQILEEFIERSKASLFKMHFPRGYIHGDLNVGNIRYNQALDSLSVIDWPDGSLSVGQKNEAIGFSCYNVVQVENELLSRQAEGLTKEESKQLMRAFLEAYSSAGIKLPQGQIMDFFSVVDLLGALKWYVDKKETFRPKDSSAAKRQFEAKMAQLQRLLLNPALV